MLISESDCMQKWTVDMETEMVSVQLQWIIVIYLQGETQIHLLHPQEITCLGFEITLPILGSEPVPYGDGA